MYKIIVKGIVQGVGFRPYIYKKAKKHSLVGTVRNIGGGVEIIINDKDFLKKITDLPPLAKITSYSIEEIKTKKKIIDFKILPSQKSEGGTILPADLFVCADCMHELKDKKNRRNNYYFITCTNCGPRFSMIQDYPYDRKNTSMNNFKMCKQCEKEYVDSSNRRYHAETIACTDCGPELKLIVDNKEIKFSNDIEKISHACELIKQGAVFGIKGNGGFHLCSTIKGVFKIRDLLKRPDKPFALMVKDVKKAEEFARISKKEKELLESKERPIVVLKKKDYALLKKVSELNSIGVILPYTALHQLIVDFIDEPLVMTSCNIPGEPISINEAIANNFLTHERIIVNRCDDSVIKVIEGKEFYLRRSRGYTPLPIKLPVITQDTIALGAEMNSVISVTKNDACFSSQYLGETSKHDTFEFLKNATEQMIKLTRAKPKIIVCDKHPGYNSIQYAKELAKKYKARLVQIQHHKAHVASVAAEHRLTDYVGIAMDGAGYGEDGKIWGGEIFSVNNSKEFKRIGHLEYQPMLGGDSSAIHPKKMLFGILSKFLSEKESVKTRLFDENESKLYLKQLKEDFNVAQTSSTGRILDATAALLGICDQRSYDGRPAMLLESVATTPVEIELKFKEENDKTILLTTPLFEFLIKNMHKNKGVLAATAQSYLARGLYEIAKKEADKRKVGIVFSGGVAYNEMITTFMIKNRVLLNNEIPCGDGGISYGQAYLANL